MKVKVINYTFDASAKTVTFTDYSPVLLNSILLITNVTDNIIIYNFADATKGGTVATNVLTLTYDTTSMDDTDKLLIYYDDTSITTDYATQTTLASIKTGTDKIISAPSTSAKQDTGNTSVGNIDTSIGAKADTAASTDTGTFSLIALFKRLLSRFVSGTVIGAVEQSGIWTVQPGNTANTTAWKVDGSAATQPVSAVALPLPSGAATSAKQDTGNTSIASIDTKTPALGQALSAASVPVVLPSAQITTLTPPAAITGFATETTLGSVLTTSDFDTKTGSLTETAPATDTASSGLNGRLQRIAQRLTSLIALLPTALGSGGGLKVDGSGTALPVSGTVTANILGSISNTSFASTIADGADVTLGSKADAKSTATDTTSITIMSVLKQISSSIQAAASSLAGTLTVASHAVTNAGTFAVQDSYLQKNIESLNGLKVRTSQFSLVKKIVLPSPSTVSGNTHMAFDGDHTVYFYSPATTNSQIYKYDILTDTVTALTNGTTLQEAYAGATILYANSKLYFTRGGGYNAFYSINTDGSSYTVLTSTANGTNFGCAMVWDGSNYIYLRNATPALERYSISGNSWSTMTAPGSAGAEGQSLVMAGTDRLYSLQGGGTTGFSFYSISGNTWTAKTATPGNIYDGGALAWNGDNYIYAFQGNGATTMYRYDILGNSWDTMLAMPVMASTGSGMITMKNGMILCYLTDPSGITAYGVFNNLYVFDPTNNSIIRGRYNSTQPTLATGQQGEFQLSADGSVVTALDSTTEAAADSISNTIRINKDAFGFTPASKSYSWIYNNSTWDRVRSAINATNSTGTGIQAVGLLAQFDDTSPTAITENQFGNLRMSANRNAYTTIRDAAGNERGANVNASNQLSVSVDNTVTVGSHAVTNAGTFATQVDGAALTSLQLIDDTVFTDDTSTHATGTTKGQGVMAVANPTDAAVDANDIGMVAMTLARALKGDMTSVAGTAIVNGGTAGSQSVGGMVANNGTINSAVNPILVGGQAVSSENAANTTAKLSQFVTDLVGKLIVLPYANPENFVSGAITSAMTGTTTTSLIAAPAAGLRNYITQITVSNSHATVGTDVIIQDGSGGTTLYTIPAAAVYGGAVVTFPTPLRQPTTATAIFCANVTTGASTKVSASGYKGV